MGRTHESFMMKRGQYKAVLASGTCSINTDLARVVAVLNGVVNLVLHSNITPMTAKQCSLLYYRQRTGVKVQRTPWNEWEPTSNTN